MLCTGNSCRSQMAHGFLQSFDKGLTVCSAGTLPAGKVNAKAVAVMQEVGIDISDHNPKSVDLYLDQAWDYVITVCDEAKETCPVFRGQVKHRLHLGFEDPSRAEGTEEHVLEEFRRVRDEIRLKFFEWYQQQIKSLQ